MGCDDDDNGDDDDDHEIFYMTLLLLTINLISVFLLHNYSFHYCIIDYLSINQLITTTTTTQLTCVSVLDDSQASRYKTELDGAEMVAVNGVRVM